MSEVPTNPDGEPAATELDVICNTLRTAIGDFEEARDRLDTAIRAITPYALEGLTNPNLQPITEITKLARNLRSGKS